MTDEKVWCPRCEEERHTYGNAGGGLTCIVCLTYIPAADVILAEQEADNDGRD